MKSNTSPQFVGLDELKRKHKAQLADFEQWAASGNKGKIFGMTAKTGRNCS
jgi:hypothetical protein